MPDSPHPRGSDKVREHLANERTFLSWVRLALSSAGFGFVVARFGLFLRETASTTGSMRPGRFTELAGVTLVLVAPLLVILAGMRYFRTEREIERDEYIARYGAIWTLIAATILLGLLLAGYLLLSGR